MSTATDSVEQKCYIKYLISKYISTQESNSQKQMLETQYNTEDRFLATSPVTTPTE